MTVKGKATERKHPAKPAIHSPPGIPFLDSGLRRNDGGDAKDIPATLSVIHASCRLIYSKSRL